MKLDEILINRLKALYKSLRKTDRILSSNKKRLKGTTDNIELLDLFLEDVVYIENLRNHDTTFITDLLREYKYISDISVEKDLSVIKLLLKGIYDRGLKTTLNDSQKNTLDSYIDKVTQLFNELSEKKSKLLEDYRSIQEEKERLEDEILRIEILIEKLKDPEDETILSKEDLDVVRLISEDETEPASLRKAILIAFIEYNNDRKNGKSKLSKVDIADVLAVFNRYSRNLTRVINKYSKEVETNANIRNIEEVLSYMQSVGILDKFGNAELLTICLYGNKDSVESEYEEVRKKDDDSLYYNVASIWINNVNSKKMKKRQYRAHETSEKKPNTLHSLAHQISREEMEKNIEYLINEGFDFDTDEPGVRRTITTSNYRLREAVNALRLYGILNDENIYKFKVWLLSASQLVEKMDKFIELGLLNGHNAHAEYANYIKRYPAQLYNIDYPIYLLLYRAKQTMSDREYYETIASGKPGCLSGELNSGRLGTPLNTLEEMELYRESSFVSPETRIENYLSYEELIDCSYDVQINNDILQLPEIRNLEENFSDKDNPFVYVFDGVVISRIKVLRNYSLINDGSKESLMTAIVKGSFLTEESFNKIAQSIDFTLGGNNGLLKTVQSN